MRLRLDVCIGFIIAGIIITALGLLAALGGDFPGATWNIMGNKISSLEWAGLSQSLA